MRIRDLLAAESIELNGSATDKKDVLNKMVDLMAKSGKISDIETYRAGVFAREEEGTTGIGEGIAIPHCKSDAVNAPGLAAMVVKGGVEFDSLDGAPVHILFLIAAPNTKDNVHLDVLSKLSVLLMDENFTKNLMEAKSVDEFLAVIDEAENEKDAKEEQPVETPKGVQILAVTGCPTGIAHTYMAAEALEKKAVELGYTIKVETRGSSGAKNVVTDEEIANAVGIIVAADTKVPMDRFDGKKVIECKVADGINKAEQLLNRVMSGDAPVYHATEAKRETKEEKSSGGIGHMAYTHLMSGVSHMLPFVIGGGIMTAIAFLIDTILGYGVSGGSAFGSCTPLSAFFKYCGGLAMGLMVPVLAGYIAYSIADRPGLAVGFTGGLLASSGNALVKGYQWAGETTGFQKFIENFAFQGIDGGSTVSGFLGGILAGFLAGFIILFLKKVFSKLPASLDGIKPTLIYPLLGILIISILMCFIFNPLIGLINTGLSNMLTGIANAGFITVLGLILGAMMAIDMGGPFNKAAYVTATGLLASGTNAAYIMMGAVMIGGMVPPIAIALSTTFFKNRWTAEERKNGPVNYIMGLSFITEGAIPYAAGHPLQVIPSCIIGSATAGALAALFKCTLMAPHGGIFVLATIGNALYYFLSLAIGAVVGMLLLALFMKKKKA